jgi:hypothetical protein
MMSLTITPPSRPRVPAPPAAHLPAASMAPQKPRAFSVAPPSLPSSPANRKDEASVDGGKKKTDKIALLPGTSPAHRIAAHNGKGAPTKTAEPPPGSTAATGAEPAQQASHPLMQPLAGAATVAALAAAAMQIWIFL